MIRSKSVTSNINLRKWSKVIQPLIRYNRTNNLLNYPLDFFYLVQKIIQSGESIELNIPPTLTGTHDNFLQTVYEHDIQDIGEIRLTPSFGKSKFQIQVENITKEALKRLKNKEMVEHFFEQQEQGGGSKMFWFPFVVMKQKNNKNSQIQNNTAIWNAYEYKKISNIDVSQIAQAYIFTKNLTASIIRFFYDVNSSKCVAYKVDNFESFIGKKKSKMLWKVQEFTENSCTFLKIMYQNKSFYTQTVNLVKKMEKYLNKQIVRIITDWVIDPYNRYYLIDVKQIQMGEPKLRPRISKSLNQLLSTVTCSMCLQTCNQLEITKILTNKLINSFYEHLRNRGVTLSFKINSRKMANICKVCDLCYSLVVQESRLIEAQRKLGQACNFLKKGQSQSRTQLPNKSNLIVIPQLHQWRSFLYLEDIKNFFQILTSGNTKYNDLDSLYLSIQMYDEVTYFQIKRPFHQNLKIKAIKVLHIFSQTLDLNQFLQSAEIRVQIMVKPGSPKIIAQGCIHGTQGEIRFNAVHNHLQRKYKQMLLFNEDSKYCVLGLYIGLSHDGLIDTNGLEVKKTMGVYKIEKQNIIFRNLPAQWMEIIDPNYCESIKAIENYEEEQNQIKTSSTMKNIMKNSIISLEPMKMRHTHDHLHHHHAHTPPHSHNQPHTLHNHTIGAKLPHIHSKKQPRPKLIL